MFLFTSFADRNATKRNRFILNKYNLNGRVNGPMANTLYLPNLFCEMNLINLLDDKYHQILKSSENSYQSLNRNTAISTNPIGSLTFIPDNSVDYIFTDPPFGHNIQYSELNLGLESFIEVKTAGEEDLVVNEISGKALPVYTKNMVDAMKSYYRVLKPKKWITVEFHNSKASVWHAIQEAMGRAGFVVAHVATLDKKQKTVHQDTNTSGTVNQDLVISAYKPNSDLEEYFTQQAGNQSGAWEFVSQHLAQLPVVAHQKGIIEILAERQKYLLFDRMVAFHIQRGFTVPFSAVEFYEGLRERFTERDSMFFLPEQVPEYDKARLESEVIVQLTLFVTDEETSIKWLHQQLQPALGGRPQTYQEIQPQFLKQLHQLKHEALPELSDILEENFLENESGRWYVPDPNEASDLEKIRKKALLKEFETYRHSKKKLKVFRTEALLAGFVHAWGEKDFITIVQVAERLPESVIYEDDKLLAYYDNASMMVE